MTDQKVYTIRYNQAFRLCQELLYKKLRAHGKEPFGTYNNLIQSVLASLSVIDLIMEHDFDIDIYKPILVSAIDETRKQLFPDLAKKRFIPIDQIEEKLYQQESKATLEELSIAKHENNFILQGLPEKSKAYIKKIINDSPDDISHLRYIDQRQLLKKVSLISQLFPDHHVPFVQVYWNNSKLNNDQIIDIYKCILAGIEKNFPEHFLKTQAQLKSKLLVRFLFTEILKITDAQHLLTMDKNLFHEYKLTNVLRFFNYSLKKLMHNAFPEKFVTWQGGKISTNFWDQRENRINAIRWLIQKKLAIDITIAKKIQINKRDFSRQGLSYMFNTYYNSTSKALNEAYPELMPWQTGSLPGIYWDKAHTQKAIFWMLKKTGWQVSEIPFRYNSRQLTRKTFSQFGLSGLFENKFNCNIYKLVQYVWPGEFKEWEFGNMKSNFWDSAENRKKFSKWFAEKFNINMFNPQSSFGSLEEVREYRFFSSLYRYCRGDFKRLLKSYALDLAEQNKSRLLIRKWERLIEREKETTLQSIILHGFFFNHVKNQRTGSIDKMDRMKRRIQRYV
jgi:Protein of unknown function (DUF4046)